MKFYRMNGLGNKFNIFDLRGKAELSFGEIKAISLKNDIIEDYDQLIILLDSKKADCYMKIYNIDGSPASACGNASRCVAHNIISAQKSTKEIQIETINRILNVKKIANNYQVNMGKALLNWKDIPLETELNAQNIEILPLEKFSSGFALNVGNPHIVFFTDNIDNIDLESEVSHIETHRLFPELVNVNIAQIISKTSVKMKTWERGAGATKACGTGACATIFAAYKRDLVTNNVKVELPGGALKISISKEEEIFMTGGVELESSKNL